MTDNQTDQSVNGHHAPPPADIPFGDLPSQVLSPLWAEGILRELFEHHREIFGRCMMAYTTGIRATRRPRGTGTEATR